VPGAPPTAEEDRNHPSYAPPKLTGGDPLAGTWLPDEPSPALRRVLARVGARTGEVWLHLLGLALEAAPGLDAPAFVARVAATDERELRRHLVGVHVPAWREALGVETLERAAAGDSRAAARLLASDRYYAGRASEALAALLPLSPRETKRRLVAVLRRFSREEFEPRARDLLARIEAEAARRRPLRGESLIAAATRGYAYEREPELPRVVLVPHLAARPWLLLCQHRDVRVIGYPVAEEPQGEEEDLRVRTLALGRALGDEGRIRILRRLARGGASLDELAEVAGLARSTAHHHLALLRDAQLVTLRGNARRYRYQLRREGLADSRALLASLESPAGDD
jgi:DNA-binding transcriptional ArsR family regulator